MQAVLSDREFRFAPRIRGLRGCLIATICLSPLLAACAAREGDVVPALAPVPEAPVWPSPPDTARYALAGILIGEQDFIDPSKREASGLRTAFNFIVGLTNSSRRYAELRRPVSGLVRADGSVLVVDAGHKGIAVFDMTAKRFYVWDEASRGAGFESPVGIVEDGLGGYFVTDSELGQVFRLDASGNPAGSFGKGALTRPTGIARDPVVGTVYVADTGAHDVKAFDAYGVLIETLGSPGRQIGRLNGPTHIAFHQDRLYVTDTLNFRIQAFDRAGNPVLEFGELGLNVGNLTRPKGVAIGGDGRVYVVESYYDHLLVFDAGGTLLLPIGGTGSGVGQFYLPAGVWTDGQGRVYVADMFNGRVVVLSELTGVEEQL